MQVLCLALGIYNAILFARLITSWFPRPPESMRPIYAVLYAVTEPVLRLARPLIPPVRMGGMGMDLSPLLVFVVLAILRQVVCSI